MNPMAKTSEHGPTGPAQTVRNTHTGKLVTVRGVGALKGRLLLKKSVDLTKPIVAQALKRSRPSAKHKH